LEKIPVSRQALEALISAKEALDEKNRNDREPIAIVGIGCRFPGGADDAQSFWQLVESGRDVRADIPLDRWNNSRYFDRQVSVPGKLYVQHGHFIKDYDYFDHAYFGLNPADLEYMDPQHLLLLETAAMAIQDGGMSLQQLRGSDTGIFCGGATDDYFTLNNLHRSSAEVSAYDALGSMRSIGVGRLAHLFDWHGPVLQLDTACSSSLVAVHLACLSLRQRETSMAIAGGVNLLLSPENVIARCQLEALSPDGRSRAFDDNANGYGMGEGCGTVVLKRLSDALRDDNKIYAVIQGSAVNHDGHSSGVTVPSQTAQSRLLETALKGSGVAAEEVAYIEAHGSGTALGDPIEVAAINKVFAGCREKIKLASVKSNIGHLEAAAGIAGLIKAALAAQQQRIPAHRHFSKPNQRVNWRQSAVEVLTENQHWPQHKPFAGVSAFGLSGTNCHVLVGRFVDERTYSLPNKGFFALAAKDNERLKKYAAAVRNYLKQNENNLALPDIVAHQNLRLESGGFQSAVNGKSWDSMLADLDRITQQGGVPVRNRWLRLTGGVLQGEFASALEQLYQNDWLYKNIFDALVIIDRENGAEEVDATDLLRDRQNPFAGILGAAVLVRWLQKLGISVIEWQGDAGCRVLMACMQGASDFEALYDEYNKMVGRTNGPRLRIDLNAALPSPERLMGQRFGRQEPAVTSAQLKQLIDVQPVSAGTIELEWMAPLRSLQDGAGDSFFGEMSLAGDLSFQLIHSAMTAGVNVHTAALFENKIPPLNLPSQPFIRQRVHWPYQAAMRSEAGTATDAGSMQYFVPHWQPLDSSQFLLEAGNESRSCLRICLSKEPLSVAITFDAEPVATLLVNSNCLDAFSATDAIKHITEQLAAHETEQLVVEVDAALDERSVLGSMVVLAATLRDLCLALTDLQVPPRSIVIIVEDGQPVTTALSGLVNSIRNELPRLPMSMIFDRAIDPDAARQLAGRLNGQAGGSGTFLIDSEAVYRQVYTDTEPDSQADVSVSGLNFLVTGGSGYVAGEVCRWLVEKGANSIVLMSRSGSAPVGISGSEPANIQLVAGDASSTEEVERLFSDRKASGAAIDGVIHCAGLIHDAVLKSQSNQSFIDALQAKAESAWVIHRVSQRYPLKFLVMISSVSGVVGIPGQSNYALANRFLNALSQYRRLQGLPAVSLALGPMDGGMFHNNSEQRNSLTQLGVGVISSVYLRDALAFGFQCPESPTLLSLCVTDLERVRSVLSNHGHAHPFSGSGGDLLERIRHSGKSELKAEIRNLLLATVRSELKQADHFDVDEQTPLSNLGVDSLRAMSIRERLNQALSIQFNASLLFDYPTIEALCEFIISQVAPASDNKSNPPEQEEADTDEAIAIIGMGCRFPGGIRGPEQFWQALSEGRDLVETLDSKRWNKQHYFSTDPEHAGRTYCNFAGLIANVDCFDPEYFGITPREAMSMDPQQRVFIETAYDALGHAGYDYGELQNISGGVFAGAGANEYLQLQLADGTLADPGPYDGTGSSISSISGRTSYLLDWHGPSITVDTACSSSLVGVHLAGRSLIHRECDIALAGGVNLLLSPLSSVALSKAKMLSVDGRCKTFDANANGYVRSDGCGVVVLKRLADAIRDNDVIYAVVAATAVNQDGKSQGLTAPNGPAQVDVISKALNHAQLDPDDITYVEAHGTGTPLGDPIEMSSLQSVYADQRLQPLYVGSVKANMGHAEAAAGVAGLIKTTLSLYHGLIPRQLHFNGLNPHINLQESVTIPTENIALDARQIHHMGVSSFGFTGTNVHTLLRSHDHADIDAVHKLENRLRDDMALPQVTLQQPFAGKVVWLFSGQGAQYAGMGKDLYESHQCFADAIDRCDAFLTDLGFGSLKELLWGADTGKINNTRYTQPALFSVEYALAQWLLSLGYEPDYLVGHSLGEYTAACVAGVLDLQDALTLVYHRAALMDALCDKGKMIVFFDSLENLRNVFDPAAYDLSVAALNSSLNTVLSGTAESVDSLLRDNPSLQPRSHVLNVSHAFHSPMLAPMAERFHEVCSAIHYSTPKWTLISNLNGEPVREYGADYWCEHLLQAVEFEKCIQHVTSKDHCCWMEIGPGKQLLGLVAQITDDSQQCLQYLNKHEDEACTALHALTHAQELGLRPDWTSYFDGKKQTLNKRSPKPLVEYKRQSYWQPSGSVALPLSAPMRSNALIHPLIGPVPDSPGREKWLTTRFNIADFSYYDDHRVNDNVVLPIALIVDTCLTMVRRVVARQNLIVTAFNIYDAIIVHDGVQDIGLLVEERDDRWFIKLYGWSNESWQLHCECEAVEAVDPILEVLTGPTRDSSTPAAGRLEWDVDQLYRDLSSLGLNYGPQFQLLESIGLAGDDLVMDLKPVHCGNTDYSIDPRLMDACFQGLAGLYLQRGNHELILPVAMEQVQVLQQQNSLQEAPVAHAVARLKDPANSHSLLADLWFYDAQGEWVGAVKGLRAIRVDRSRFMATDSGGIQSWYFTQRWYDSPSSCYPSPPQFMAGPSSHAEAVSNAIARSDSDGQLANYERFLGSLEAISVSYVLDALNGLQIDTAAGTAHCLPELFASCGIAEKHRRLFDRLIEILEEENILERSDDRILFLEHERLYPHEISLDQATRSSVEYRLLDRCGQALPAVLTGQADPLELLFPEQGEQLTEQLYKDSVGTQVLNGMLLECVAQIVAQMPEDRQLRILEVGAGTAATTLHLLQALPQQRIQYCVTDVSRLFVEKARATLADYPDVQFEVFDIERSAAAQQLTQPFDLIIAANVVHATQNLYETLQKLKPLLRKGGLLAMVEGIGKHRFSDLIFGLTEGWWRFNDTNLRSYPMMHPEQWSHLLHDTGFDDVQVFRPSSQSKQGLVMASHCDNHSQAGAAELLLVGEEKHIEPIRAGYERQGIAVRHYAMSEDDLCDNEHFDQAVQDFRCFLSDITHDLTIVLVSNAYPLASPQLNGQYLLGLATMKTLAAITAARNIRLTILTRQALGMNSAAGDGLLYSGLWGMARVFNQEHPEFDTKCIDVDSPEPEQPLSDALLREIHDRDGHREISWHDGYRKVMAMERVDGASVLGQTGNAIQARFENTEGVTLITGGMGGIGVLTAKWLANHGIKKIALIGRREPAQEVCEHIEALNERADVRTFMADVAEFHSLQRAVSTIVDEMGPIKGVIHSVGVLDDALFLEQTPEKFARVLSPKVQGLLNLHRLTLDFDLDQFVVYSSATNVIGTPGQGNHSAANRFLDEWIQYRRRQGLVGQSIVWGPWSGVGEIADDDMASKYATAGLADIPPDQGVLVMDQIFGVRGEGVPGQWVVLPIADTQQFLHAFDASRRNRFYHQLHREAASDRQSRQALGEAEQNRGQLMAELRGLKPALRFQTLVGNIGTILSGIANLQSEQGPDIHTGFFDMGIDSLMAVELKNRLEFELDVTLPSTLIFKYPNIAELTSYILEIWLTEDTAETIADASETNGHGVSEPLTAAELDDLDEDELAAMLAHSLGSDDD